LGQTAIHELLGSALGNRPRVQMFPMQNLQQTKSARGHESMPSPAAWLL
jgi:hypothetical protein